MINTTQQVTAVAHRGDPWAFVENTLPGFASAIAQGADVVELDARVCADDVPVVIHDETFTRIWGLVQPVADTTAAEVAALSVPGSGVPTLTQALDLFTGGITKVMVDLPSTDRVDRIIAVVHGHPARDRVLWSGETDALAIVRAADPDAVICAHSHDTDLSPVMINMDGSSATAADRDRAHAAGQGLSVWTIDDPELMSAAIAMGVDSITTNRLDLLLKVRDQPVQALPPDLALYRDVAVQLGSAAIRAQRAAHGFTIETKANPADLVTDVDRAIERRVRGVLTEAFPDHVVVGEEYGGEPGTGPTWYCDPVDGTTNFANGLPWSSFSLSLVVDDQLTVGVVADPWRNEIYVAVAGYGAFLNGIRLTATQRGLSGSVVLTELNGTVAWDGMLELLPELAARSATMRVMGSGTLTLAQPAADRAAAAIVDRFNPIDHGASVMIAVEAGCEILDSRAQATDHKVSTLLGKPVITAVPGIAAGLVDCLDRRQG